MIRKTMRVKRLIPLLALPGALLLAGCSMFFREDEAIRDGLIRGRHVTIETTAYCPCGHCCGWKLNWRGQPVHTSGPNRGKPKAVGITASGKKAKPGTLAADTRYYPMGTVFYIPGYGYGVVEDRGGDIRGRHRLDLFYNTHKEARNWGRKKLQCIIFPPGTPPIPKNARPPQ
jgi:3D (Asp-Asp-Asp) domain-containing protein